jgi:hypothetical protein
MKKNLVIAAALLCLAACSTFYSSVISMTAVVDSGMKQWAQLSVAGKTSLMVDNAVKVNHDRYRQACAVAQASLISYKETGDKTAYIQALTTARTAANGLFDIILPLLNKADAATLSSNLNKANAL